MLKGLIISIMILGTSLFAQTTIEKVAEKLNTNILNEDCHWKNKNMFGECIFEEIELLKSEKKEDYRTAIDFFLGNVKTKDNYIENCNYNNKEIYNNDITLMIDKDTYNFGVYTGNDVSLDFEVEKSNEDYKVINYCFMSKSDFENYETIMLMLRNK